MATPRKATTKSTTTKPRTRKPATRKPVTRKPAVKAVAPVVEETEVEEAPLPRRARPKVTGATIRNLRGAVVHLRLFSNNPEKPYRIALEPRGTNGDTWTIPHDLTDDPTFLKAIDVLVEVITPAEERALKLDYTPGGYQGRTDAPRVERPEDTTIMVADNYDGKARQVPTDRGIARKQNLRNDPNENVGQQFADLPGTDQALHAALRAGQSALPPEATFDRGRVQIERVRGDRNI